MDYVDLGYFLVVAEKLLGMPAERLGGIPGLVARADSALSAPKAAFSGQEQYPDFAMKAAVLCVRLIKSDPLPKGNKRAAFLSMNEFIERNGFELAIEDREVDELYGILVDVAAGKVSEEGSRPGYRRESADA